MKTIAIQPIPSQIVKVVLGDQQVQILIQQKEQGIFVDIKSNGVDISASVLAQNLNALVNRKYLGFFGNLYFMDMLGVEDPEYSQLGSRFILFYLDEAENELVRR